MAYVNNNQSMREITERLEKGVAEIFSSEKYREYLKTMSRFHKYSLNNTILIAMQKPEATFVAGFKAWQSFERHVKKGESGIKIIAPVKLKLSYEEAGNDSGKNITENDGLQEKDEVEPDILSFKVVNVFDISQTEGKELPKINARLTGDIKGYEDYIEAVKQNVPVPVEFIDIYGEANGFFDRERIAVRKGMSEIQTIKTLIHEAAHAILHSTPEEKTRETKEVEAESVAYTVCSHFGIDTSEYSFGYIASWSSTKELKELRDSLETIQKTASDFITGIEKTIQEVKSKRTLYDENFQSSISGLYGALEDTREMFSSIKKTETDKNHAVCADKDMEFPDIDFSEEKEFHPCIKM